MLGKPYSDSAYASWESLVSRSPFATFLHTRKFFSYHGSRFEDMSLMLESGGRGAVAVFPAAVDPNNRSIVTSHPGSTYGGVIHRGDLYGEDMIEAIRVIGLYYQSLGFTHLHYKAVPHIYHVKPSADDLYALFRLQARRYRCDLSAAINLQNRPRLSERRRRGIRRAEKIGVQVLRDPEAVGSFWEVLEENLARKYERRPVHTCSEMEQLLRLFPEAIELIVGTLCNEVVGGVVLFQTPMVAHAQYIASSEAGNAVSVLDAVFEHCIQASVKRGQRYFDFGISNEQEGWYLNKGLYHFKREFGAGGVPYEFYELNLTQL